MYEIRKECSIFQYLAICHVNCGTKLLVHSQSLKYINIPKIWKSEKKTLISMGSLKTAHIKSAIHWCHTGARLDARTYTFAHPIWRTTNAARKQGAISPILPVFCKYYLCDAIMLIKLRMVWSWVPGITTLEVAIVVVNFARDARMNTVNVCRMRERIKQDARTSLFGCANARILFTGALFINMD